MKKTFLISLIVISILAVSLVYGAWYDVFRMTGKTISEDMSENALYFDAAKSADTRGVVYVNNSGTVFYKYEKDGAWNTETFFPGDRTRKKFGFVSLEYDSDDVPYVIFLDSKSKSLRSATKKLDVSGELEWQFDNVASDVGAKVSNELKNFDGTLYLVYHDDKTNKPIFAYLENDVWVKRDLSSKKFSGINNYISFDITSDGRIFVGYYDSSTKDLYMNAWNLDDLKAGSINPEISEYSFKKSWILYLINKNNKTVSTQIPKANIGDFVKVRAVGNEGYFVFYADTTKKPRHALYIFGVRGEFKKNRIGMLQMSTEPGDRNLYLADRIVLPSKPYEIDAVVDSENELGITYLAGDAKNGYSYKKVSHPQIDNSHYTYAGGAIRGIFRTWLGIENCAANAAATGHAECFTQESSYDAGSKLISNVKLITHVSSAYNNGIFECVRKQEGQRSWKLDCFDENSEIADMDSSVEAVSEEGSDSQDQSVQGGEVVEWSCIDEIKNGAETDIDCGGESCPKCAVGKTCSVNADCEARVSCGSEESKCGGGGAACSAVVQCISGYDCINNACSAPQPTTPAITTSTMPAATPDSTVSTTTTPVETTLTPAIEQTQEICIPGEVILDCMVCDSDGTDYFLDDSQCDEGEVCIPPGDSWGCVEEDSE